MRNRQRGDLFYDARSKVRGVHNADGSRHGSKWSFAIANEFLLVG